jgi:hypothetical protein
MTIGALRRRAGVAVLALAMMLRLLVPQGWMPDTQAGSWRLILCSGTGPMQMATPHVMPGMAHKKAPDPHHDTAGEHPCTFASLALALDLPAPLPLLVPAIIVPPIHDGLASLVSVGRGLAAPPPPATGPPLA